MHLQGIFVLPTRPAQTLKQSSNHDHDFRLYMTACYTLYGTHTTVAAAAHQPGVEQAFGDAGWRRGDAEGLGREGKAAKVHTGTTAVVQR